MLHEWQPPELDPNHVVSNFAYLFKFLFVYSYEVVTFDPCVCFSPFWYQNDEGGNVKQDILLVWPKVLIIIEKVGDRSSRLDLGRTLYNLLLPSLFHQMPFH